MGYNINAKRNIICEKCGKPFVCYISDIKLGRGRFCSKNCTSNRKGKKASEDTRKKISEANYIRFKNKENHPRWKGGINRQNLAYRELHRMIGREKISNKCEFCGKIAYGHKIHWANIDHKYRKNPEDWMRLCSGCHGRYDKENGLRIINKI